MSDDVRAGLQGLLAWHRATPRDLAGMALRAERGHLYALVDVARDPALLEALADCGDVYCAVDETREPDDLGATAPVVVALTPGAATLQTVLDALWGLGAAVFFASDDPFAVVYRRVLLRAGVDPTQCALRFWNPQPLRAALDGGDASLFDGVTAWLTESPDGRALLRYTRGAQGIAREEHALTRG